MLDAVNRFLEELERSLSDELFVKLTLSNYRGAQDHLQKITVRPIETKKGRRLLFQFRYDIRDVAKNYQISDAIGQVRSLLESGFRSAHLFTSAGDFQLTIGKKSSRLASGKPTFSKTPDLDHDRRKNFLIDPDTYYLKALGITTDNGSIRAQHQDKWRQINKYVEVLRDLFDHSPIKDKKHLRILDMGSGKGYLTFAAYDYFTNTRDLQVEMTGVEVRPDLVQLCNQIAMAGGFDGLSFLEGSIAETDAASTDILIALHACDTATDDALFKGISAKASIIVAAPCCHREIRRQIKPPELLADILKHGTMLEREAETVTDGLRSMLLERSGYSTKLFEFVSTEHTPKNNMIVGIGNPSKRPEIERLQGRINALKAFYGIRDQRLENLLA